MPEFEPDSCELLREMKPDEDMKTPEDSAQQAPAPTNSDAPEVVGELLEAAPPEAAPPEAAASAPTAEEAVAVDGIVEEAASTDEPESSPEALRAEVHALREAVQAQRDDVLRAQAEVDNMRKRMSREVENAHKYGLERIMNELLPVRDSLELGLAASRDEGVDVASVRDGVELTLKMLDTATSKFGLIEVDPEGEPFDPERHQAISIQEVEGREAGTVLNVVQKGYVLNERLVRPAMVIVAK